MRVGRSPRQFAARGAWRLTGAVERGSQALGTTVRRAYTRRVAAFAAAPLLLGPAIELSVLSFVREPDVPQLVASIRCFLSRVGVPREFVVVSDGTVTADSHAVVESILPGVVSVQPVDGYVGSHDLPLAVRSFMATSPWGSKLASIMALGDRAPGLYVDSDIWYFPLACELQTLCKGEAPLYMLDLKPFLDQRMMAATDNTHLPVNAGMLFVPKPLDWSLSVSRLAALAGRPTGRSEQAAVHLAFVGAGGKPFPVDRYVINPRNMRPPLKVRSRDLCVRHYTGPRRRLFWLNVPRFERAQRRHG